MRLGSVLLTWEVTLLILIQKLNSLCLKVKILGGWIKKCTRYFGLCKVHDSQKVDLASLYLKGSAETWFVNYILGRKGVSWEDFVVDIYTRFNDNLGSKVVEDFNRLQ